MNPCRVTADGRYQLWVNGTLVGRGPVRSEPGLLTWDEYDLTAWLMPGENVIAVLGRHYGIKNLYWKPARPMGRLGQGGVLLEADLGEGLLVSDGAWMARRAPFHPAAHPALFGPPATEVVDGRAWPWGWTEPGFDDTAWQPVTEILPTGLGIARAEPPAEPFGLLSRSRIGQLSERLVAPERVIFSGPVSDSTKYGYPLPAFASDPVGWPVTGYAFVPPSGPGWYTLDFGRILNAHPVLELEATPGTLLDLAAGEDLDDGGSPVVAPRNWTMRFTASGRHAERVESFEPVGLRYLRVAVRRGEVSSLRVSARERHYPRPAGASFVCDDPFLNELWQAGARTLDACSTDAFVDCPGREQRAWLGDAYVDTLVSLACNPDTGLVRWNARLHGQGVRPDGLRPMVAAGDLTDHTTIPDFSLHWIRTLAAIHAHLEDLGLVEDLLPRALEACGWFERHRGEDGLLVDLAGWLFLDWAQTERRRQVAAVDALYALALDDLATLSESVGDTGTARRLRSRADRSREAMERYWDPERGVYVDAADPGGPAGRRVSQQTNALAILSGSAAPDRWASILEHVLDPNRRVVTSTPAHEGSAPGSLGRQFEAPDHFDESRDVVAAQPFFAHFVHQAVVSANRRDLLFPLLMHWEPLVARGNGVLEEYWDAAPGRGSRCHAWSATPTYDLTAHIAGVRPGSAGFRTVCVEPTFGPLAHVEAAVPTPHGFVQLSLDRDGTGWVELPEGTTGTMVLPTELGGCRDLRPGRQHVGIGVVT